MRRLPRLTPSNRNDIDPSSLFCQSRFVPFPAEQTIKKRKYRERGGTCHARAPAGIPGAARPRTPGRSPRRPGAPGTGRVAGRCTPGKAFQAGSPLPVRPASGPCNFSPGESGGGGGSLRLRPGGTDGRTEGRAQEDGEGGQAGTSVPAPTCLGLPPAPASPPRSAASRASARRKPPVPGQPQEGCAQGGQRRRSRPRGRCRERVPGAGRRRAAPPCPLPAAGGRWPRQSPAAPRRPAPPRCPRAMNKAEAAGGTGTGARLLRAGLRRRPSPPPPAGGKQRRRERQGELPVSLAPFSRDSRR